MTSVSVVTPVYSNAATLPELADRLAAALAGRPWRLRFVIDGSPDDSAAVARRLAAADGRIAVSELVTNGGQHRALARGLRDEAGAGAWVCLDADLQDPPEAVPMLVDHLLGEEFHAVFAGRRGAYEGRGRLLTGRLHRALLARVTDLPADAGAFVALSPVARDAILRLRAPSIVVAVGVAGLATASLPVERARRTSGTSAWLPRARLWQSGRSLVWASRARAHQRHRSRTQRWTNVSV